MGERAVFAVAIQVLLFAVLVTAATSDLLYRKVYNWTTYPAIAFGLTLGYCVGDLPGLENHFLGFGIGVVVFGAAWLSGLVGGADMKLIAAIGAIEGFPFIIPALWYSGLIGCAHALGHLVYHGCLLRGIGRCARVLVGVSVPPLEEGDPLAKRQAYAVPIAVGTMIAWALYELGTEPGRAVP